MPFSGSSVADAEDASSVAAARCGGRLHDPLAGWHGAAADLREAVPRNLDTVRPGIDRTRVSSEGQTPRLAKAHEDALDRPASGRERITRELELPRVRLAADDGAFIAGVTFDGTGADFAARERGRCQDVDASVDQWRGGSVGGLSCRVSRVARSLDGSTISDVTSSLRPAEWGAGGAIVGSWRLRPNAGGRKVRAP